MEPSLPIERTLLLLLLAQDAREELSTTFEPSSSAGTCQFPWTMTLRLSGCLTHPSWHLAAG